MVPTTAAAAAPAAVVVPVAAAPAAVGVPVASAAGAAVASEPAKAATAAHICGNTLTPALFIAAIVSAVLFTGLAVGLGVGYGVAARSTSTTTTVTSVQNRTININTTVVVNNTVLAPFWPAAPAEDPNATAAWSYDLAAEDGPTKWGEIVTKGTSTLAYPLCAGTAPTQRQTPVDLPTPSTPAPTQALVYSYDPYAVYQIAERPGGHPGFQVRVWRRELAARPVSRISTVDPRPTARRLARTTLFTSAPPPPLPSSRR